MSGYERYFGSKRIEEAEEKFYEAYLAKANEFLEKKEDADHMKQLSSACGNVVKMRQSRGSAASLKFKIDKQNE